jgi:hypothetical protein
MASIIVVAAKHKKKGMEHENKAIAPISFFLMSEINFSLIGFISSRENLLESISKAFLKKRLT